MISIVILLIFIIREKLNDSFTYFVKPVWFSNTTFRLTVRSYPKVAIYAPTYIRRTTVQIYTKLSYEALHRHFWVGAVTASGSVFRVSVHRAFRGLYSPFACPEKPFFVGKERSGKIYFLRSEGIFIVLPCVCFWHIFLFCVSALALCRPQERGRQCAKSV